MRSFRVSLAATAVMLALGAGNASAQFTNIYFFGDSLTDSGSYKPVLPPGTGLFTTNPGPRLVASARAALRRHRRAGQSGRDELRPGRCARHRPARRARQSADRHRNAHRDAGGATRERRAPRQRCALRRLGWGERHLLSTRRTRGRRDHACPTAGERRRGRRRARAAESPSSKQPAPATSSFSTCRISAIALGHRLRAGRANQRDLRAFSTTR